MRQLLWRTLRRMATRAELWNGNREEWRNLLTLDPHESILLWAWTRDRVYRSRYEAAQADLANAHLEFVRLRDRGETDVLLSRLTSAAGRPG
jgi:hypothetical protein